jgi:replicative DNA helicase
MKLSNPIFRLKREARLRARSKAISLHQSLDEIARQEGFRSWNHLASGYQPANPAAQLLSNLDLGDLLVLAARPRQGKTVLGLEILAEAAEAGRRAVFFSTECTKEETDRILYASGHKNACGRISLELGDTVSARQVQSSLGNAPAGMVAVVDYLQVMDQCRSEPPLGQQIAMLRRFAAAHGAILVFLSQVHRSFDPCAKAVPGFMDLRVPNPIDLSLFNKGCFLHDGALSLMRP